MTSTNDFIDSKRQTISMWALKSETKSNKFDDKYLPWMVDNKQAMYHFYNDIKPGHLKKTTAVSNL